MCLWYVHMLYYNSIYVPLLLGLSNDIEENPSLRTINDIVDPTNIKYMLILINGMIKCMDTGKQWVAMSLYAIVYNEIKSVNIWDQSILNTILMNGNSLYSVISQSMNKNYSLLTDVPELVDIGK